MLDTRSTKIMKRRKVSRVEKDKLTHPERMEFVYWYKHLISAVTSMKAKHEDSRSCETTNDDCTMPTQNVRNALIHAFETDWRYKLSFEDKKRTVNIQKI